MSRPSMEEPLSWLTLERYALGELPLVERTQVEQRLASSSTDRACLDEILNDRSELPPLPHTASGPTLKRGRAPRARVGYAVGMLAMAAALALVMLRPADLPSARREVHDGIKGGEVALLLVSERHGEHPTRFADDDRFKLLVTCPTWLREPLHVSVFQAGQRYAPLPEVGGFPCGNRVPWPGAFALEGDGPVDVCVSWGESAEAAQAAAQLAPNVVCSRLSPR